MKSFLQVLSALLIVGACVFTTGCNTVAGAGKDVKAAGGGIEEAAEETKEEIKN